MSKRYVMASFDMEPFLLHDLDNVTCSTLCTGTLTDIERHKFKLCLNDRESCLIIVSPVGQWMDDGYTENPR